MFVISSSPHIFTNKNTRSIMLDVIIALMPALFVSVYVFGIQSLIVTLVAVSTCILFEWIIQKYLLKSKDVSVKDGSAIVTGILLAYNLPSNIPLVLVIIGSFVAIVFAKMSYGGIGNNIFNPALIARVFLLISFPVDMTTWPTPLVDGTTGATALGMLKGTVASGGDVSAMVNATSLSHLFFGIGGGSLGEVSAIAILIGGLYLLIRKVITWHIPVTILAVVCGFSALFYGIDPHAYATPVFHLVTGGVMLGAWFMATDYTTSPMFIKGQIIFAIGIGLITMIIRFWGAYPEGISFAILLMNALVPLIDKIKPKRFGAK